jgi:antirestriction protein ArdC
VSAKNHPELIAQLTEGISNLTSSEKWRAHLAFQSRFHHYSFGNVLLIAAQCPKATQVAGFNAWRKLNRFVRKGERAIWILAPLVYRNTDAQNGGTDRVIRGFRFVAVFDITQTEGERPPSVCDRLYGEDQRGLYARLLTVAHCFGFRVEDHEFNEEANGDCCHAERRIRVESTNSPAQRVKTLAHELAHALLHENCDNRALAELEAESTAYIVCKRLGIDSGEYSFGYVATWAGDGKQAIAAIRTSCDRIQKSAAAILQAFEPEAEDEAA